MDFFQSLFPNREQAPTDVSGLKELGQQLGSLKASQLADAGITAADLYFGNYRGVATKLASYMKGRTGSARGSSAIIPPMHARRRSYTTNRGRGRGRGPPRFRSRRTRGGTSYRKKKRSGNKPSLKYAIWKAFGG